MTVRFTLQPPAASVLAAAAMKPGGNQFVVKAVATSAGKTTPRATRWSNIRTRHAGT
jgi:hypothetical protein